MSLAVLLALATLAGTAAALQGQAMGSIDRAVGTLSSIFVTYGVGGLLALTLWLAGRGSLSNARDIPPFAWSSGLLGLIIVGSISFVAPRLGLTRAMITIVAAQLLTAVIIDHFGLLGATATPVDWSRVTGIALAVVAVWLVVR